MSAEKQLARFIAKYTPDIAAQARAALATMRKLLPGAIELVYDNYNGLVIGFGPTERASEAIFSIVLYPRWVTLFFLFGAQLRDPKNWLRGSGKQVRHIVLDQPTMLEHPYVRSLMAEAMQHAPPLDRTQARRIVIKSISPRQRPRRPSRSSSD